MDLAPPPAGTAPASTGPVPTRRKEPDAIIGGVAALLGARLDVEALWVRIAFVLLALVGGVGVVLYGALWLLLVVGRDPSRQWARWAGGALLVVGLPLVLTQGFAFFDGPVAVVALLVGLAVALWQPRRAVRAPAPTPTPAPEPVDGDAVSPTRWRLPRRPPRPPSILGRLALGGAVLVAAAGALIDEVNGGRLYPEQWLGAAAIVCGAGLIVGAVRGRARWLIVPAAVFAGTGFVAGEAARIGIEPSALIGDEYVYVDRSTPGGSTEREHVVIGTVEVWIEDAPAAPMTVDARSAIGTVRVSAADDVTVEVLAEARHGDVRIVGADARDRWTLGPEGRPDVVVIARVGRGDVVIGQFPSVAPALERGPTGGLRFVADGVGVTPDGQFVLGNGEAVIGADGAVLAGAAITRDRVTVIATSMGDFQLLPGGLLLTPFGQLVDLHAARGDAPGSTIPGG